MLLLIHQAELDLLLVMLRSTRWEREREHVTGTEPHQWEGGLNCVVASVNA